MASTIVTKNSSTASAVPVTGDLTQGELAVNVTDKKLYTKDSGGTVVKLVGGLGNQEANAVAITGGSINGTTVGATTASTGAFTTLSASSTVSGTGFSTYLASPPAIGGTAAAAGSFTTLSASSTTTLSGGTANGVAYLNGSKVVTTGSALVFDGTNLGIGTSSPGAKLDIGGTNNTVFFKNSGATTGYALATVSNTGGVFQYGVSSSTGTFWGSGNAGNYSVNIGTTSAVNLGFGTGDTLRMLLDSSGNLGLGVTPSAWGTTKAIQYPGGAIGGYTNGSNNNQSIMLGNAYFGAGGGVYINSDYASYYRQYSGTHAWFTAPSGTAGNAITFTQAMTLDASGRLFVGTTSGATKLDVRGTSNTVESTIQIVGNTVSSLLLGQNADGGVIRGQGGNNALTFWTGGSGDTGAGQSGTERARITSGGDFVVNGTSTLNTNAKLSVWNGSAAGSASGIATGYSTTNGQFRLIYLNSTADALNFDNGNNNATLTSGGTWTNASDARLKKNIQPIKYGLETVLASQPKSFNRVDVDGEYIGFIAQELQTQIPEVVYGNEDTKYSVDYGSLVAVAFKAIQEQQALITALTARVAALEAK